MIKENAIKLVDLFDPEIANLLHTEEERQRTTIGLIASENVVSPLAACLEGSIFTNKNTEGYAGKRYVGGCANADAAELLAVERLKTLFGCDHANIQASNATIANLAVLVGLLNEGDTILSMNLSDGGHLSHGAKFHMSGQLFNSVHYGVNKETERIDMGEVRALALEHKPRMIICGASSYPRTIDYEEFRVIADEVGAYMWADCAHDIGLIAGGAIPSPVPYVDVVTFSTQKTLRGPRGCGIILCKKEFANRLDRGVFPRLQGGPKADMLAARAVLFKECMEPEFKAYAKQVVLNANALAKGCAEEGLRVITGGTDTHMVMLDVTSVVPSGQVAENTLNDIGLVTNKNMIPFDQLPPSIASGLRIGSSIMTTRGAKEDELYRIGRLIGKVLKSYKDTEILNKIKSEVYEIATSYPVFSSEWIPSSCRDAYLEMVDKN